MPNIDYNKAIEAYNKLNKIESIEQYAINEASGEQYIVDSDENILLIVVVELNQIVLFYVDPDFYKEIKQSPKDYEPLINAVIHQAFENYSKKVTQIVNELLETSQ